MTFPRLAVQALPVLLALVLAAGGCVSAKKAQEAEEILTYTDWESFNRVQPDGNIRFGSGTDTKSQNGKTYSLYSVVFANTCDLTDLTVTYNLDKPSPKAFKSATATGEIRVDDQAPIQAPFTYQLYKDKDRVYIDFDKAWDNKPLVDQIMKGSVIRITAKVEGREMTFRFTLKKCVDSLKWTLHQCQEEQAFRGNGGSAAPAKPSGQAPAPAPSQGGGSLMGRGHGGKDSQFFK